MSIYLYNFTLQKPSAITHAVYGNFSDAKAQEIVVSRGTVLELLRVDDYGRVQTILSTEIFGLARSILPFRLTGTHLHPNNPRVFCIILIYIISR
jgi:splicing factor 3B subunit 3